MCSRVGQQLNLVVLMTMLVLLVSACGKESYHKQVPAPDYWPTQGWKSATPEKQGMSSNELLKILDYIHDKQLNMHSLLIIRHGYVVLDAAFYPYPAHTKHDVASVTKTVTATLIGQAIDRGLFKSIDQPVYELLGDKQPLWDTDKKPVSLKHLVTMSSGLDCGYKQGEVELMGMITTDDWLSDILMLPMKQQPGKNFAYCSGNTHLLSALLQVASGVTANAFANKYLFTPLGIDDVLWPEDPQGITRGWGDLRLRPKDMAKIGFLHLHSGQWNGRQILSQQWITQATTPQVTVEKRKLYYGYSWWLHNEGALKLYAARGRGGQRIAVWPDQDMVIVTTGGGVESDQLITFIVNAIKSSNAIAEDPSAYEQLQRKILAATGTPEPTIASALPTGNIPHQLYALENNPLQLTQFDLILEPNNARLKVLVDSKSYDFPVGLRGVYRMTSDGPNHSTVGLKGKWIDNNIFSIDYHEIDGINHFTINAGFSKDKVQLEFVDPTGYYNFKVNGYPR